MFEKLFTEKTRSVILAAIKSGMTAETAASKAKITSRTLRRWLARGKEVLAHLEGGGAVDGELDRVYMEFTLEYMCCRSIATEEMHENIRLASKGDWRAAAWLLERMRPDEYSNTKRIGGPDGGPVQVATGTLSEFIALARDANGEDAEEGEDADSDDVSSEFDL